MFERCWMHCLTLLINAEYIGFGLFKNVTIYPKLLILLYFFLLTLRYMTTVLNNEHMCCVSKE